MVVEQVKIEQCQRHLAAIVCLRLLSITMSGTLISSLTWIPRGRAATHPKKYSLDENEIERVGKMGGEGVLEKLRQEMEAMDMQAERDGDVEGHDAADDGDWQE